MWIVSAIAAFLLIAGAVTLALTLGAESAGGKTFTLNGSMAVSCTSTYGCVGYSDIHSGAQVEVYNEKREILATGYLTKASEPSASRGGYSTSVVTTYTFTIPDVPRGAKQYGVHVGNDNRGIIWATEDDASTLGFVLTLG
ncbi:hypothetical protein GCM10017786_15220 [Amycolatopsis deserti]|uniref:Uncharacterized protein n=1 Tax=Amycolatopsis deserti TaxID=185696 RepID=A0ABQ3II60_9PSEU|nr:hypothetical protein [Amycolatopsis deserti]GHE84488.1 hypothetical protein GCM10017786_15220 [Amycolatopsis deserti]